MAKQMVTLKLDPAQATLGAVKDRLGLKDDEVDPSFGVVSIDPAAGTYAVLVEDEAAGRVSESDEVSGPFSNPAIDTFD